MTSRPRTTLLAGFALAMLLSVAACGGSGENADAATEEAHEEEGAARVTIPEASAQASGIVVSVAGPGVIQESLILTGRIVLQPSARADVHAPYPGPVRAVLLNVGDNVRQGQTLARVESAESLQTYSISSPINGIVLDRQTNIGDVTSEAPLFVVGDLSRVQAELNVVVRDIGRVAPGQAVVITGLDGTNGVQARIATVLPTADVHSQTIIARAPLTISAASPLRPGMAVRGSVVLAEQQVGVAVPRDAVQTEDGRTVIFVRVSADTYEVRPVTTGRTGSDTIEITAGLAPGEAYVSENAFLVKAEIGKDSASHGH